MKPPDRSAYCTRASPRGPCVAIALLLFAIASGPAAATVITVNTTNDENNFDGDCSLREAVRAANTDAFIDACPAGSGVDTILVPSGTYNLTISGAGENHSATGDLDILGETTIESNAKSPPIIRSQVADRAFEVRLAFAGSVVFRNIQIIESGVLTSENGGGIHIDAVAGTDVLVEDCSITDNQGFFGGGIDNYNSSLTVRNTTFSGNLSYLSGGGMSTGGGSSFLLVEDSLFVDNVDLATLYPLAGTGTGGGGIFIEGSGWVRRSTFLGNTTRGSGGGVVVSTGDTAMIDNSTFSGNHADDKGGGIHCGTSTLDDCFAEVRSSTITGNSASSVGGGIHAGIATPYLTLQNSIVAGNSAPVVDFDIAGFVWSHRHNIIGEKDPLEVVPVTPADPNTDLIGPIGSPIDPLLAPIGYNGYDQLVHRLRPGSPAIDSGDDDGLTTDQRGAPRPVGLAADRGAVERVSYGLGLYLDLGTGATLSGSTYGAAALIPGVWNEVGLGNTALDDWTGSAVGVGVLAASDVSHTPGLIIGPSDDQHLLADSIFDCSAPAQWSLDFSNLIDSEYLIFLYAPAEITTGTGDISFGLQSQDSLPGDIVSLVEFESYTAHRLTVSGGTLSVSGEDLFAAECAGAAGIQLLPEPHSGISLVVGAFALALSKWRRDRRRRRCFQAAN